VSSVEVPDEAVELHIREEKIMATYEPSMTLIRLSDTDLTLADRAEDIRGRKALDMADEELGEVDDLLIDEREQKVRFLQVTSGGFLGLGATKFLLPVEAITRITDDAVYINQSRERVAGAPAYDPTLVDERYVSDVYSHYGYPPYWGLGYEYPAYPYYPDYPASTRRGREAAVDVDDRLRAPALASRSDWKRAQADGMPIKAIMTREVEVVHPEGTLREAAQKMATLDVGPLPVCKGDEIVGMLTDRDITVRATAEGRDPKTTKVYEVMTPEIVFAYEDEDVSDAAQLMAEHQIRRLVVLDRDKRLVGIVSLGDLAVHTGDTRQAGETLEGVSDPSAPQR
jgi:CBS domain-containing protein/sporulation protein YlmC with PRC-barrel domain